MEKKPFDNQHNSEKPSKVHSPTRVMNKWVR